jgi:hypothetical protein
MGWSGFFAKSQQKHRKKQQFFSPFRTLSKSAIISTYRGNYLNFLSDPCRTLSPLSNDVLFSNIVVLFGYKKPCVES